MQKSISKTTIRRKTSNLTMTALFATLICITTAYIFHIPFGANGGYVHIGDTLIYLGAALLPTPYAMAAGALGGLLADLFTAPVWAPATFIIKLLIALPFTSKKTNIVNVRNVVALFIAAFVSIVGYYIAEVIIFGNAAVAIASIVSSSIQAICSGVLFIAFGLALDKVRIKNKF